jgi:hypothetical protein
MTRFECLLSKPHLQRACGRDHQMCFVGRFSRQRGRSLETGWAADALQQRQIPEPLCPHRGMKRGLVRHDQIGSSDHERESLTPVIEAVPLRERVGRKGDWQRAWFDAFGACRIGRTHRLVHGNPPPITDRVVLDQAVF